MLTSASAPDADASPVDWQKSITRHAVTCLEGGQSFKQLSIRHLGLHGLDTRSYQIQYGIPRTQPLAARSTTERRRQVVQETQPWVKSPMYRKGQTQNGHPSPEAEARDLPEQIEASVAAAAQPKRGLYSMRAKSYRRERMAQSRVVANSFLPYFFLTCMMPDRISVPRRASQS